MRYDHSQGSTYLSFVLLECSRGSVMSSWQPGSVTLNMGGTWSPGWTRLFKEQQSLEDNVRISNSRKIQNCVSNKLMHDAQRARMSGRVRV
jgi:hypothetical protein